jgi:hypothetical protein
MHLLTGQSVREFVATKQITVLEHPAYSPDGAHKDLILLTKIKKGRQFGDTNYIRSNAMAALKAIPQNQFQNCFAEWTSAGNSTYLPKRSTMNIKTVVFSNEFSAMSS